MAEQLPGGPGGRHPEPDLLTTLALGEVHEPGRSDLARHLAACESCREEYSAVVAGLEQVLAAAPTVAPPPGFEGRVLAAMGVAGHAPGDDSAVVREPDAAGTAGAAVGGPHPPTAGMQGRPPGPPGRDAGTRGPSSRRGTEDVRGPERRPGGRRRRRSALVVAAGAVAGLLVGAGGALVATQDAAGPAPEPPPPTAGAPYTGADLVRADGAVVGHVTSSRFDGEDVLVVDVAGAPAGVRYECRGVMPDGTEVRLGTWTIGPERSATWVVPDPGATGVRLVTGTGTVWADAAL